MDKKIKPQNNEVIEGFKKYSDAIMAHMDKKHGAIVKILEKHDGQFQKIDEQFKKIDGRFEKISGRLDKVEGQFDKLNGCLDRLESAVIETSSNVKMLKIGLERLDRKVDIAITNHEQRIRKIETHISV